MIFHTFGNGENGVIVLLHGMLTPWQIFVDAAKALSQDFCVIVPELDAHAQLACFEPEKWLREVSAFLRK